MLVLSLCVLHYDKLTMMQINLARLPIFGPKQRLVLTLIQIYKTCLIEEHCACECGLIFTSLQVNKTIMLHYHGIFYISECHCRTNFGYVCEPITMNSSIPFPTKIIVEVFQNRKNINEPIYRKSSKERFKRGKSSITAIFLLEFRFVPLSSSTTMKLYFQYVTNINFLKDGNGPQYLQCQSHLIRGSGGGGADEIYLLLGLPLMVAAATQYLFHQGRSKQKKGGWRAPKYVVVVIREEEAWD